MAEPEQNPKKKKLSFKEKLNLVFNGVSKKELKAVFADTLKDLRKPKEIGIFIVSSVLPGGWIGYAAYRIAKYKYKHQPANDNTDQGGAALDDVKPAPKARLDIARPDRPKFQP